MPASGALTVEAVGPNEVLVTGSLTDVAANQYWTITLPGRVKGAVLLNWRSVLTGGTGTSLHPVLRSLDQAADSVTECEAEQTAATVYEEPRATVATGAGGVLYYYPGVDAETDNAVSVSLRFKLAWGD